jgi:hypothetical protein
VPLRSTGPRSTAKGRHGASGRVTPAFLPYLFDRYEGSHSPQDISLRFQENEEILIAADATTKSVFSIDIPGKDQRDVPGETSQEGAEWEYRNIEYKGHGSIIGINSEISSAGMFERVLMHVRCNALPGLTSMLTLLKLQ